MHGIYGGGVAHSSLLIIQSVVARSERGNKDAKRRKGEIIAHKKARPSMAEARFKALKVSLKLCRP